MNIIEAVEQLKVGKAIQRSNWGNAKWTVSNFRIRRLDTGDARFAFW